jgi:mRNA interferase MazF
MIQDDIMNQYGLLTIVMPLRPGVKQAPYVVNIKASSLNGLDKDLFYRCGSNRAVEGGRVLGLLGVLEPTYWQPIQTALDIVLGFSL